MIVGGYFLAAAVRPIIAMTAAAWQVVVLRVVDRLGKGLRTPPRDALIADVTPAPMVGRAFDCSAGWISGGHHWAAGGWAVLSRGADVRSVILWSIVPGVLVTVLATWAVRDVRDGMDGKGTCP